MANSALAACTNPVSPNLYQCDGQAPAVAINNNGTARVAVFNQSNADPLGPFTPASGSDIAIVNAGNIAATPSVADVTGTAIYLNQAAGGSTQITSNAPVTGSTGGFGHQPRQQCL